MNELLTILATPGSSSPGPNPYPGYSKAVIHIGSHPEYDEVGYYKDTYGQLYFWNESESSNDYMGLFVTGTGYLFLKRANGTQVYDATVYVEGKPYITGSSGANALYTLWSNHLGSIYTIYLKRANEV